MKAKEFIPSSKPRNFVAKNQKTAGAGAHKDKKKAEKQGDVKHKNKFNYRQDDWSGDFERRMKKGVVEGSAHGYNVAKWYEKWNDQGKLTKWLKKEAGLPKDAPVYFDDADLVYDDKTIVRDALVDPKLKFIDLLNAVAQAGGGKTKRYSQGIYREHDVEEAKRPDRAMPATDLRVGDRVVADTSKENYPGGHKQRVGIVTRVGQKGVHIRTDDSDEPEWHPYKIVKKVEKNLGYKDVNEGWGDVTFKVGNWAYRADEEDEGDVRKMYHSAIDPNGKEHMIDFSPYAVMDKETFKMWIKSGMPKRQGSGPLDKEDIMKIAQAKGIATLDREMARAGMK